MDSENPTPKGQAWFCATGLPSDVTIQVEDMNFHLHKFPLMSKSRKIHDLITEQERRLRRSGDGGREIEEEVEEGVEFQCHISLPNFPGGLEAFEAAAKFCYGVKVDLSASNVAPLRCAGEYLGMTEEYSGENLILKTERFFSLTVLKNVRDSIKTLDSCEKLLPMAETLGIVPRCIDAIAAGASSADPSLLGWPVSDRAANRPLWDGVEGSTRRKGALRGGGPTDSWREELGHLSLNLFKRLISAMKDRNLNPDVIENCLICYAKRNIPGLSRSARRPSSSAIPTENDEQREILEATISNLPTEKSSRSSTTRILFGLLRSANILDVSENCRSRLERKIGSQLEQATLDDLLIPSYSSENETLYDVDCVERILGHFLSASEERSATNGVQGDEDLSRSISASVMVVGRLIDGYLSEIASDSNLTPEKFCELAVSLPEQARLFDDGLYRAVDVYLKEHPWMEEAEREKICGVMDCRKLTLEACTHAAQNDRLPLRAVVQVLFFEQLQLRHAIAGALQAADLPEHGEEDEDEEARARVPESGGAWREAVRQNRKLRVDMDSMRARMEELERECNAMKRAIDEAGGRRDGGEQGGGGWRKKFGCKFRAQVCDSHVGAARKEGRTHRPQ